VLNYAGMKWRAVSSHPVILDVILPRIMNMKPLLVVTAGIAAVILVSALFCGRIANRYHYAITVGRVEAILQDIHERHAINPEIEMFESYYSDRLDCWNNEIQIIKTHDQIVVISLGSDSEPGGAWHASDISGTYTFSKSTYTLNFDQDVRP